MDPRHVLAALAVLLASGCAAAEDTTSSTTTIAAAEDTTSSTTTSAAAEDTTSSTTTSAAAAPSTRAVETSLPTSTGVEPLERDGGEPEPVESVTPVEPETVDPVTTTTVVAELPEVVDPPLSSVEETEGDSDSSAPENLQVSDRPESAVAVLQSRLEALVVEQERRSGYDRELFDHWVDADGDRCDARREVLIAEAVLTPRVGTSCSLSGGEWFSVYDGVTETGSGSGFDVDHLVPLAEAWDSGAYSWDSDTRRRYANDLGYAHSLVAVSSSSNRQKGADDPADWLPPLVSARCWYAEAWIAVKTRWDLSVDAAELQALRSVVSQCEDWELGSSPVQASPVLATATTVPAPTTATTLAAAEDLCHPAYIPCLPNLPGDALNCGDLSSAQKPVQVRTIGVDPYRLDRDRDGFGCTS